MKQKELIMEIGETILQFGYGNKKHMKIVRKIDTKLMKGEKLTEQDKKDANYLFLTYRDKLKMRYILLWVKQFRYGEVSGSKIKQFVDDLKTFMPQEMINEILVEVADNVSMKENRLNYIKGYGEYLILEKLI